VEVNDELVRLDEGMWQRIWWPERVPAHADERFVPNVILGKVDGLTIVLQLIRRCVADVAVEIGCLRNERTAALDEQYATALAAWETAARSGGPVPVPPEMPGTFLNDVPVVVSDDLGTPYTDHGRRAAGTGREWEAELRFHPPVPAEARTFTVRLAVAGGEAHVQPLSL
jgi:hypothetical protein